MVNGLDDVIAAETILSAVDGHAGTLVIRGYPLAALAGRVPYEGAIALLWNGFFDELPAGDRLSTALGRARADVFERMQPWLPALRQVDLYDGVRAGIALLPDGETLADALRLAAAPAVIATALIRLRSGGAPIRPDPDRQHAVDILRMLGREELADTFAPTLDTYLVAVCDHGLNASTFAARVVASTQAGLTSAALAGLSALKGPLHGGAPGPVIAMLDAIAASGDARSWLEREVASGRRLMGFGHRIYRVRDPRADVLKAALTKLGDEPAAAHRLAFAGEVEAIALAVLRAAKPDRPLLTNVEYYTALLLEAVGFTPDAFTTVFAMGRMAGWIANAREQRITGRLLRPQSRYIGPPAALAA
jgi:citrate synthase